MKKEFEIVLDNFKNKNILVIGDILLDKFSWGEVNRVNPEQPAAPLVRIIKENYVLGGAANVANNIVSLGAKCCLYGVIGRDYSGERIKKMCRFKKIIFKDFRYKKTILKQRIMAHGQQITRMDFGEKEISKIGGALQDKIIGSLKKEIKKYDFIILSDYDKFLFNQEISSRIINLARENNIPVLVDPKPINLEFFKGCYLICPNKKEAEIMSGIKYSNGVETLEKMARILSEKINSRYVIITCGEDGVFSYGGEENRFIGTKAREVSDVTGAGDTFASVLALGLACKLDINDAVTLANYAAGIVVGKVGTATATINEIKERIEKDNI